MPEPSPATQKVLDALCLEELNGPQQILARAHAAAALYAAADQVVPDQQEPATSPHMGNFSSHTQWLQRQVIRLKLLAIVNELEQIDLYDLDQ